MFCMALITCPECQSNVSEYAESCPQCGCPINIIKQKLLSHKDTNNSTQSSNVCCIAGITFNLSDAKKQILNDCNYLDGIKTIRNITGLGLKDASNIAETIRNTKTIPTEILKEQLLDFSSFERFNRPQTKPLHVPKCPTCGSLDVGNIGGLERGASILTLGIFSKKINKSFKCNNCGYLW